MKAVQIGLASVGLAVGVFGLVLLLQRPEDLVAVGTWLFGGVALHDAILAPVVIGVCLLGVKVLPAHFRRAAAMTLIIFGSLTLIAIPVLGRFGAKADNPTLLDRNYVLGWLVLGALALAGSVLATRFPIPSGDSAEEPKEV